MFDASEDTMHPLRLRSTRNSVDAKEGSHMFLENVVRAAEGTRLDISEKHEG